MFYFVTLNEHYCNFEALCLFVFFILTQERIGGALWFSQLCWKHQRPAWLLAAICTRSLSSIFPNFLFLFKNHHRTLLQTGWNENLQIPPRSCEQMRTEREDLGLLGNKQTEHNEGIVLYVLSETDFTDYLIYIYIYIFRHNFTTEVWVLQWWCSFFIRLVLLLFTLCINTDTGD